jgi:hypothetical protein
MILRTLLTQLISLGARYCFSDKHILTFGGAHTNAARLQRLVCCLPACWLVWLVSHTAAAAAAANLLSTPFIPSAVR